MKLFANNARKLQSHTVTEDWKKCGITLHPGARDVWNSVIGGFLVNHLKFNVKLSTTLMEKYQGWF